jgi:hypothetical protein
VPNYPGLIPSNVSKDAKYSVKHGASGGWEISLLYRANNREKELLSTDRHDGLVALVNAVKEQFQGSGGGAFYINEYLHVLVPTPTGCVYAGCYEPHIYFEYDGRSLGPTPPDGLEPGDSWPGPHVGIRYTLAAGGDDIRYEVVDGRRTTEHYLSDFAGREPARALAQRLAAVKGQQGGRLYINEAAQFFSPMNEADGGVRYVYLGALEEDSWFPAPPVPDEP